MQYVLKACARISGMALLFGLLGVMAVTGPFSADAQSQKVLGSTTNHGITLKINGYSIIENGQRLKVDYTIHTPSGHPAGKQAKLMKTPRIWIGDTLVRGDNRQHHKIGDHLYQGEVEAPLEQYRPEKSHVRFNTDAILNQKGNWKVDFVIQKT